MKIESFVMRAVAVAPTYHDRMKYLFNITSCFPPQVLIVALTIKVFAPGEDIG